MSDDEAIKMLLPDAKFAIMEDGEVAMQVDGALASASFLSFEDDSLTGRLQSRSSGSRCTRASGSNSRYVVSTPTGEAELTLVACAGGVTTRRLARRLCPLALLADSRRSPDRNRKMVPQCCCR